MMEEIIRRQLSGIPLRRILKPRIRNNKEIASRHKRLHSIHTKLLLRNGNNATRHLCLRNIERTCQCLNINCSIELGTHKQTKFLGPSINGHMCHVITRREECKRFRHCAHLAKRLLCIRFRGSRRTNVRDINVEVSAILLINGEQLAHEQKFIPTIRSRRSLKNLGNQLRKTIGRCKCPSKQTFINRNGIVILPIDSVVIGLNIWRMLTEKRMLKRISISIIRLCLNKSYLNLLNSRTVSK